MKNKFVLICFLSTLAFVSCNDHDRKEKEETQELMDPAAEYTTGNSESKPEDVQRTPPDTSNGNNVDAEATSADIPSGHYRRVDAEDEDCSCSCFELHMNQNSELCLKKDEIYIQARFSKDADGKLNVFYVKPSEKNTNDKLPWDKFDTNKPIAVLTP
ncbi:MAG: hypothetical protein WBV11_13785, partial [Salegentibacter sp.]